nr:MAG TPA: hypothetical protein [Bacteriophage sp.]
MFPQRTTNRAFLLPSAHHHSSFLSFSTSPSPDTR